MVFVFIHIVHPFARYGHMKMRKSSKPKAQENVEEDSENDEEENYLPQSLPDQFRYLFKLKDQGSRGFLEVFQIREIVQSLISQLIRYEN